MENKINSHTLTVVSTIEFLMHCVSNSPYCKYIDYVNAENVENKLSVRDALIEAYDEFYHDIVRWGWRPQHPKELFEKLLFSPYLLPVYFYRLSHALFGKKTELIPTLIANLAIFMTGVEIYYSANIGEGLKLIHGHGTVIGANTRIGKFFTVYQGVTVGDKLGKYSGPDQRPVIGDHVIACAGSAIIGPVNIGDRTIIGMNSVVTKSIPSRSIVVGSPAYIKVQNLTDEDFEEFRKSIKY